MMRVKCEALCIVAITRVKYILSGCDLYYVCINGCMQYAYTCDHSHFASVCVNSRGGSWVSVRKKELKRNDTFSFVFSKHYANVSCKNCKNVSSKSEYY